MQERADFISSDLIGAPRERNQLLSCLRVGPAEDFLRSPVARSLSVVSLHTENDSARRDAGISRIREPADHPNPIL